MIEQSRIILILKYLYEKTDAEHYVSNKQIKQMLAENGFRSPDIRTIDADIALLIAAGHNIVEDRLNGRPTRYKVLSRDFEPVDLKILIDAVAASRFITIEKSKQLITKLASMATSNDRVFLESELNHVRSIKKAVGGAMRAVEPLFNAIVAQKKVQFQMVERRAPDKALVSHKKGKLYTVSPYATIWCNDRYYLICFDEDRDMIITPRLDHIRRVQVLEDGITPPPKKFDIGYYYTSVYKMYGGPEMDVTIECENSLIGKFIDRFGLDFECVPVTDHSFQATVKACVGNTFFGWLCQYAGQMKLVGPEEAVTAYREQLVKAMEF